MFFSFLPDFLQRSVLLPLYKVSISLRLLSFFPVRPFLTETGFFYAASFPSMTASRSIICKRSFIITKRFFLPLPCARLFFLIQAVLKRLSRMFFKHLAFFHQILIAVPDFFSISRYLPYKHSTLYLLFFCSLLFSISFIALSASSFFSA